MEGRKPRHRALWVAAGLAPFLVVGLLALALSMGLGFINAFGQDLPRLADQKRVVLAETSRIYAADGTLLAYLHGVENRTIVGGEGIPKVMKDAIVAIEDHRFYQHTGVDYESIVRALLLNIESGRVVQGFSSITQQLVGNLYLDRSDVSITRKLNEMALAWQLEEIMTKDEILDQYLNTVYFGSNAYGVDAAARTYFDKSPSELTLAEAALLAGLVQAPTPYSPRLNPERAIARRGEVLDDMLEYGMINREQYDEAYTAELQLAPVSPFTQTQEPYVVAYVRQQLITMFGEDAVYKGGLVVETTINPAYQRHAQRAISSTLDEEDDPSAALVAVEPDTGYIRAMVGGTDYDRSKFNLAAQGKRQPGSAFKTFGLVAAVEMGINPYSTLYPSQPVSLDIPGDTKPWDVKTFGNSYYGVISLAEATLHSDNTVYAQMALDLGAERIVDVARRMGVTSYVNPDPAIILGALEIGVSPLEMASAYGTLAANGWHRLPTAILRVKDTTGAIIWEAAANRETQAISSGVAHVVNKILEANVQSGTGTAARIEGRAVAGKTGTAEEFHDAWFCGYIPQLSCAVWMGHPEEQIPMTNVHGRSVTGGSFPAVIWQKFMSQAAQDYPVMTFDDVAYEPVQWNWDFKSTHAVETTTTSSSTTTSTSSTTLPPATEPTSPTTDTPSTEPPTTVTTQETTTTVEE